MDAEHPTANPLPTKLLDLPAPWQVDRIVTDDATHEIFAYVSCAAAELTCPRCDYSTRCVYDHRERRARDLDWAAYRVYIVAAVPRIQCPDHQVVQVVQPWLAKPRVHTTMRFEQRVMDMLAAASLGETARFFGISDRLVGRIQADAVERGLARRASNFATRISVDETSYRKRHRYVTVVNDMQGRVLHVQAGKDEAALAAYFNQFDDTRLADLEYVVMDMSQAYLNAVEHHTDAVIVYDRFHIIAAINRAVDQVRRQEHKLVSAHGDTTLKRTMHTLRRAKKNMNDAERQLMRRLKRASYKVSKVWERLETARLFLTDRRVTKPETAERRWRAWIKSARLSRLPALKKVANMIENHLPGVVNASVTALSNAHAESMNSRIQKIKKRANGYRNLNNFIAAIYFHYGGLDMSFST